MTRLLEGAGFEVTEMEHLNKISKPVWWLSSRVLGRKQLGKPMLKGFDKMVWLIRRVDALLPWSGLLLIAVGKKRG
ncbi:MAG: hypothetical protein U0Q16_33785 [Bryobacteraceae bacterium]